MQELFTQSIMPILFAFGGLFLGIYFDFYKIRMMKKMLENIHDHILKNRELPTGMSPFAQRMMSDQCGLTDEDYEEEERELKERRKEE